MALGLRGQSHKTWVPILALPPRSLLPGRSASEVPFGEAVDGGTDTQTATRPLSRAAASARGGVRTFGGMLGGREQALRLPSFPEQSL